MVVLGDGVLEVIGIRWGHEGGASLKGISALIRATEEPASLPSSPPRENAVNL